MRTLRNNLDVLKTTTIATVYDFIYGLLKEKKEKFINVVDKNQKQRRKKMEQNYFMTMIKQ